MYGRRRWLGMVAAAALAFGHACVAAADEGVPLAPAPPLDAVLSRLAADPVTPREYTANVDLHVKLRVFPFIRLTLHGNSSYKRPGLYHFVFRGVPKAAEKFNDLNYDLGDPSKWPARYDIAFAPQSTPALPVIRLTPKVRGMVKTLDVAVEMSKGHLMKATWSRFDGGTITLVQKFAPVGDREIVAQQTATIDIPHMKAELSANYEDFVVAGIPVVAGVPADR
ncbi:MAG: hypothetical protein ABR591_01355 [Candidatus Velthaea sp.]